MKPKYLIAILSVALIILLVALPVGPGWLTGVTLPIRQQVTGWMASGWQFVGWFADVRELSEERDALAAERNQLLARVVELEAVDRQNQSLMEQLGVVNQSTDQQLIVTGMAGLVNQGGVSYLLLNKGSADGVREGQVVMADGVLVGRVRRVTERTATVQMPQSLGSVIPVHIRYGSEVTKGVVEGNYNLTARLDQVLLTEKLEAGTVILTSGEGGTYPANLVVGMVGPVERRDNQLFQSAEVELPWDVARLETLFVVKDSQ